MDVPTWMCLPRTAGFPCIFLWAQKQECVTKTLVDRQKQEKEKTNRGLGSNKRCSCSNLLAPLALRRSLSVVWTKEMYCSVNLLALILLAVHQHLLKLQLFAFACTEDSECERNSSFICCSGVCEIWSRCPGGCISDATCVDGKMCFRHRCEEVNIDFPAYCDIDRDCLKGEECESGQCKPAPRPVANADSREVHVSFDFKPRVVIIVGSVFGGLIFLAIVSYGSCRCVKRYRRRRISRASYSQPSRYALSHLFSCSRNDAGEFSIYRQQIRQRSVIPGRTMYNYPQTPPPEYDSLTLDSNLEVEASSPPLYMYDDQVQVGDTSSRTSDEQVT